MPPILSLLACAGPTADRTQVPIEVPFVVDDIVVSDPTISLKDLEVDSDSSRLTWQTDDGSHLWVADIDPTNGEIVGADWPEGSPVPATLVDTAIAPWNITFNGPEWLLTDAGSEIVFSQSRGNVIEVTRAREIAPGQWEQEYVLDGEGALGSNRSGDADPAIIYLSEDNHTWWTRADGSDQSDFLPTKIQYNPWFIDGANWLVYSARQSNGWQVMRQDLDDKSFEVLTDCGVGCVDGYMFWSEVLDDWALGTVILEDGPFDENPLRYVLMQDLGAGFEIVHEIDVPVREEQDLRYVVSPEVFHFEGRAYIAHQLSRHPGFGVNPGEIWILGIEPGNEIVRRVSGESDMVRKDPEPLVTDDTVWIYYNEDINGHRILHRCATGL